MKPKDNWWGPIPCSRLTDTSCFCPHLVPCLCSSPVRVFYPHGREKGARAALGTWPHNPPSAAATPYIAPKRICPDPGKFGRDLPENGQIAEESHGARGGASGHTSAGLDRDRVLWSGAALTRINLDVQPLPSPHMLSRSCRATQRRLELQLWLPPPYSSGEAAPTHST